MAFMGPGDAAALYVVWMEQRNAFLFVSELQEQVQKEKRKNDIFQTGAEIHSFVASKRFLLHSQ